MKALILGIIIGFIAGVLPVGGVTNQTEAEIINSTHFRFENGTIVAYASPEELKDLQASDIIMVYSEALRRNKSPSDPPLPNSNISNMNETRIKEAQKLLEGIDKIQSLQTQLDESKSTLDILSSSSFTDEAGYYHVVGEVKNNSPTSLSFVQVTGTFYDINNKVVGTTFTYTNPSDLMAGGTAPFDLVLLSASVPMSEINTYKVSANAQ